MNHSRLLRTVNLEYALIQGLYWASFCGIVSYAAVYLQEHSYTGCRMEVSTDLPGVQFYTANFLPSQKGKSGAHYGPRCALCLETEHFPDSIHFPLFPQCVFDAGEMYQAETIYRFL